MDKTATRQRLLRQRQQLASEACRQLSQAIQKRVIDADCFRRASAIALYSAINNEVQTDLLFRVATAQGKRVCYPKVRGDELDFLQVETLDELRHGRFGVAEPRLGVDCPIAELDLIVVPGVAFDRRGYRLGYGKGFYDRELSRAATTTLSVGLCYDFQLCEALPVEGHDRPVMFLATESGFKPCATLGAGSP